MKILVQMTVEDRLSPVLRSIDMMLLPEGCELPPMPAEVVRTEVSQSGNRCAVALHPSTQLLLWLANVSAMIDSMRENERFLAFEQTRVA